MRLRLLVADASVLTSIINESTLRKDLSIRTDDIVNDWVNVILRETKTLPVHRNLRCMSERDLLDTLYPEDIEDFEDELLHTIQSLDFSTYGNPTLYHDVIDGQLEFFIYRG